MPADGQPPTPPPAELSVSRANSLRSVARIRRLFREYERSIGIDLDYQGFEDELRTLPGKYAAPGGVLLLGRVRGVVAGCAAVRPGPDRSAELKRVFVRPRFRHGGVGRIPVDRAIAFATEARYRAMVLDTLPEMEAAYRLYVRIGFREVDPYGPVSRPGTRYLRLDLASTG
ncbi:MAG: GNAT family N-acetyltransferase [Thermoplasmata archaeon]|nr:GNAT family N-acetyltransferase [Thermoplasmata archaeon]